VSVYFYGRYRPYRQDFHAPTKLLSQILQRPGRAGDLQPGVTVSDVAISHGINANLIRKWLPIDRDEPATALPAFVPLQPMPKRHADETRVIALPLGDKSITGQMARLRSGRLRTRYPHLLAMQ
jgi:hypothetical protein